MALKYNTKTLNKIEAIFDAAGFVIRYEKGNFNAGYCLLENQQVVVINRYYDNEAKINCLLEILQQVEINRNQLSQEQKVLFDEINLGKTKLF